MIIQQLKELLLWCTVINAGILIYWWIMFMLAHNFVFRLHSKWFNISVEKFDVIHYQSIVLYKLAIILFNLVPYIALTIIT